MGHHARDRPGNGRVLGGEGRSAGKEVSGSASIVGPLAGKHGAESEVHSGGIDRGLGGQSAGFRGVVVMRHLSPEEASTRRARQGKDSIVREGAAARNLTGWHLLRKPGIAGQQEACPSHGGKHPKGVGAPQVEGACPDCFLVQREAGQQRPSTACDSRNRRIGNIPFAIGVSLPGGRRGIFGPWFCDLVF